MSNFNVFFRENFPSLTSRYRRFRFRILHLPRVSYSFSGEDLLIADLSLRFPTKIRYVDIGCAHPIFDSNTYLLYRKGHNGINVDARTELRRSHNLFRRRDKFLNYVVTEVKSESSLDFFVSKDDPHTSSISSAWLNLSSQSETRRVKTVTLLEIFENNSTFLGIENRAKRDDICLVLTVDVEGHDLQVLKSNDWDKFAPNIIAVETLPGLSKFPSEIQIFLETKGYSLEAATSLTSIFIMAS